MNVIPKFAKSSHLVVAMLAASNSVHLASHHQILFWDVSIQSPQLPLIETELGRSPKFAQNTRMNTHAKKLVSTFEEPVRAIQLQDQNRTIQKLILQSSESLLEPNFQRITTTDLKLLFHVIDEVCLQGQLAKTYSNIAPNKLEFRLSKRMTSTGGMTTMRSIANDRSRIAENASFEIAIATTPLFQSFGGSDSTKVSGVICHHRLDALQRIMEHEMIHLAEFLCWDDSNCNRQRFRKIVRNRFGHRESTHQLQNHRSNAARNLGIKTGDLVGFRIGQRFLQGVVNRITKRASILVKDPQGRRYSDGEHYMTYYVPISQLKKLDRLNSKLG